VFRRTMLLVSLLLMAVPAMGLARPDKTFKVFQFPHDKIPRIDGNPGDWAIVPDSYAIGMDQLVNTEAPGGLGVNRNPKVLDVKVKVGWVKGLSRLYFLVEAYNQKWCCWRPDLHNDIFEVVADGDLSGGPLIDIYHRDVWTPQAVGALNVIDPRISRWDAYFSTQGVQAQNYHIFTPPGDNDWAMDWGCAQYTKDFPYANHAYNYSFKPGQGGKLILEFYITLFDYAGCQGPQRAVQSVLTENKLIGLSWAVIDYENADSSARSFWNLSHVQTFFGNASELVGFRLMALEPQFRKVIQAEWTDQIVDLNRGIVAFQDQSQGNITSWKWDFGDGAVSTEENPVHQYSPRPGRYGNYTVSLAVTGPAGTSRRVKVWQIHVK
jgi:PKD domain